MENSNENYRITSINIWSENVAISLEEWRFRYNRILNRKCQAGLSSDQMEDDSDELQQLKKIGEQRGYSID